MGFHLLCGTAHSVFVTHLELVRRVVHLLGQVPRQNDNLPKTNLLENPGPVRCWRFLSGARIHLAKGLVYLRPGPLHFERKIEWTRRIY